jgi:hypothetical protein
LLVRWTDETGVTEGTFSGELLGLTIDLCEEQLSPGENRCDPIWGESAGFASATFGDGTFDPALARAMGVAETAYLFSLDMLLDGVTGEPATASRSAFFQRGTETVGMDVTVVPEPPVATLLVVSLLGALGRRRPGRRGRIL